MPQPQKIFLIIPILLLGIALLISHFIMINVSPSMKEGFYIRSSGEIKRGDIVAACLTAPYQTIGLSNLYIEKGQRCNGADPLIKSVIAVPGDQVVLNNGGFIINDESFLYPTERQDSAGKKLAAYPRGKYLSKGYWLIGTNSTQSWDSRYWGPVNKEQILFKLSPLLVWK